MKLAEILEILNEPRKALELVLQGISLALCLSGQFERFLLQSSTPANAAMPLETAQPMVESPGLPLSSKKARHAHRKARGPRPSRIRTSSLRHSCANSRRRRSGRRRRAGVACRTCGRRCSRTKRRLSASGLSRLRNSWNRSGRRERCSSLVGYVFGLVLLMSITCSYPIASWVQGNVPSEHQETDVRSDGGQHGLPPAAGTWSVPSNHRHPIPILTTIPPGRDALARKAAKSENVNTFRTILFDDWLRLFMHVEFYHSRLDDRLADCL